MLVGDVITTKEGDELEIIDIKSKILICRLINWVDDPTDKRIVSKNRVKKINKKEVVFIQKSLF